MLRFATILACLAVLLASCAGTAQVEGVKDNFTGSLSADTARSINYTDFSLTAPLNDRNDWGVFISRYCKSGDWEKWITVHQDRLSLGVYAGGDYIGGEIVKLGLGLGIVTQKEQHSYARSIPEFGATSYGLNSFVQLPFAGGGSFWGEIFLPLFSEFDDEHGWDGPKHSFLLAKGQIEKAFGDTALRPLLWLGYGYERAIDGYSVSPSFHFLRIGVGFAVFMEETEFVRFGLERVENLFSDDDSWRGLAQLQIRF